MANCPFLMVGLLVLFCIFPPCISTVEIEALLQFKNQLKDPLNSLESWHDSESPCGFTGVSCDPATGEVTGISFDNVSLSGELSSSISMLRSLSSLVLTSNSISGYLPPELNNCTNLRVLNLTGNEMSGEIPDLSELTKLEILDLSGNYFSAKFPTWVGNLSSLVCLGLGDNEYNEGEIPEYLGNLKNLTWIYLAGSYLRGEIPESIFELEELETLDLSRNMISGEFPKSISKLRKLWKIELFKNNLTGEIPPTLAELTLLREFDISSNQMYGKLPQEIGNLKNIVVFQLYENNFYGELPHGFDDWRNITGFSIYRNNFSGEFPPNFGRFSLLNSIDISENNFSGEFPKFLCEKNNLQFLLALGNSFSGEFPDSYGGCKSLVRFRISKNSLSGSIPKGVWALPLVQMIDLGDNGFSGGVSPDIGLSISLDQLILDNNRFSGKLPPQLGKLGKLQKLLLSSNNFSGEIPSEFGDLKRLTSLHLEENLLTGSIPKALGRCVGLVDLNLALNSLSGSIPNTLSMLNSMNSLNLSWNRLTGSIPGSLRKLKLSSIDLSRNQLSGRVPIDVLTMGGEQAFVGNEELCVGKSSEHDMNSEIGVCDEKHGNKIVFQKKLVLICVVLASLIVVLSAMLFVTCKNTKLNDDCLEKDLDVEKKIDPKWKLESFHQVEFDVDEISDLNENNLIGSGGTGKVYRLDLKKDGVSVAVKKLWKGNSVRVLDSEMEILGKIRHKNILKLYACLMKGGSSFLVFEYMVNGNVFEAIHREIKIGNPELDWYHRYKIALGAAKGVAYLHHDCSPPIIHRDIKSTNILLDEDYEPKIADFGVAKIAQLSPRGSESSCFVGTYGYIAPEHAYTLKVTEKSDVYSFGVVLLELVTGRKPLEEDFGEGKDIVYWVVNHFNDREGVLKVLDQRVVTNLNQQDMVKVLKVATHCTTKLPSLRPTMRDVVNMLVDAQPCSPSEDNVLDKRAKVFV